MTDFQFAQADTFAAMGSEFRQQLLSQMSEPISAAALAKRHDMSRQRIGYHMRDLEKAGCIQVVEERPRRGLTEKLYQVTPRIYTQAPANLAPQTSQSAFSFARLVNVLGHALTTLARIHRAVKPQQRVATLALDAVLHFEQPAQRKAFTTDLLDAVESVIKKHERSATASSRSFRLVVGAFPDLQEPAAVESHQPKKQDTS